MLRGVLFTSLLALGVGQAAVGSSGASRTPASPSINQMGGTAVVGKDKTLRITATGYPKPAFTESGALPDGMSFVSGNGSASITGTPGPETGNTYAINVTATNSQGSDTEPYTLTVQQNPVFPTDFCPGPMTVGQYVHDDENSMAYPAFFGLNLNSDAPNGISFNNPNDNDPNYGTLSGTPEPGSGGKYGLSYSSDANNTTRNFHCKLVVNEAPAFTDPGMATATVGTALSSPISITGTPGYPRQITVTSTGTAPSGLKAHTIHNGKGFAENISGTPAAGSQGDYLLNVSASNGLTASEGFVLVVRAGGVTPQATTLTLSSEADPVAYDSSQQTYVATVTGGSSPTGYVQFSLGNGITTVPLSGGQASFTTPATLDAGDDVVSATYTGDALNAGSSATEDLTINAAPTSLQVSGPSATANGVPITITATVACSPSCGTTPTGFVDFQQEGIDNYVSLVNGQASFTTDPTLEPGLANEVDISFASYPDAAGDFGATATADQFYYDVGGVDFTAEVSNGTSTPAPLAITDGSVVTVDPTGVNAFSAAMASEAAGGGVPPGPLNIDVTQGATDLTSALGLSGSEASPSADPATGISDYFWTLPANDLTTNATGTSATVTLSSDGSDNFVPVTLTFTLDW